MPFVTPSLPSAPPPLPEPEKPSGITSSAPLNLAAGTGLMGATNAITATQFGLDVAGVALLCNMLFQWLKHYDWFDQHRYWPIALLLICVAAFLLVHHEKPEDAVWKSGAAAFQAAANYASQKASGLGIFEPVAHKE